MKGIWIYYENMHDIHSTKRREKNANNTTHIITALCYSLHSNSLYTHNYCYSQNAAIREGDLESACFLFFHICQFCEMKKKKKVFAAYLTHHVWKTAQTWSFSFDKIVFRVPNANVWKLTVMKEEKKVAKIIKWISAWH